MLLPNMLFYTQTLGYIETIYHTHDFFEIFYVLSGEILHELNGQREVLHANDIFSCGPATDILL